MEGDVLIFDTDIENKKNITFQLRFSVKKSDTTKKSSGIAENQLTLQIDGTDIKIIKERQMVQRW